MKPYISQSKHYESLAIYYANATYLLHCHASVHVEAYDDALFWRKCFSHFAPGKKINFIWASNSPYGNKTTGSAQCLKYKNFLSRRFFICIDSDYRYLLQEAEIRQNGYIFQTYTYSIENHLCFANRLNDIPQKCTGFPNTVFDFGAFLISYSNALYELFIWHLHFMRSGQSDLFSKEAFKQIIQLQQVAPGYDTDHNGRAVIDELSRRCTEKLSRLTAEHPDTDIAAEKAWFQSLGVMPHNAYLFVRGHNLFNLLEDIGNVVNHKILSLQKSKLTTSREAIGQLYDNTIPFGRELKKELIFTGYPEIERLGAEIEAFFKG